MKRLTAPAAILTFLMASAIAQSDDFGRPGDTMRVSGSNDIYRAKIRSIITAPSASGVGDPIGVFGKADYYLYDLDAWTMVSSGPVIGRLRNRSYSLFASGFEHAALNPLTMRSEDLRSNAGSNGDATASSSYLGWRF